MSAFDDLRTEIAALREQVRADRVTLRLGTADGAGGVVLDVEAAATPVSASLAAVSSGDRVLTLAQGRRVYVLGKVQRQERG